MDDLISRRAAINAFRSLFEDYISQYKIDVILENSPSAEPEQKKGKWDVKNSTPSFLWLRCSECGYGSNDKTNYCPNCGADMRGENE